MGFALDNPKSFAGKDLGAAGRAPRAVSRLIPTSYVNVLPQIKTSRKDGNKVQNPLTNRRYNV